MGKVTDIGRQVFGINRFGSLRLSDLVLRLEATTPPLTLVFVLLAPSLLPLFFGP
jgi:hypothetical protein